MISLLESKETKTISFGLLCPEGILVNIYSVIQMVHCKLKCAVVNFWLTPLSYCHITEV